MEQTRFDELTQLICTLTNTLESSASDLGDWKIIKTQEARIAGKPDPYDTAKLLADREAIRVQIREAQAELEKL